MTRGRVRNGLLGGALLCAAFALLALPGETMEAAQSGLQLCYNVIFPSLFPFFVLSSLLVELGLASLLGQGLAWMMGPLFRVSGAGASALALGLIGGYPVGARTVLELCKTGQCSREEGERLLCFCNNSGPAFILGVVGAGVFQSAAAGLLLYAVHLAAALAVGVLFRIARPPEGKGSRPAAGSSVRTVSVASALTHSVKGAFSSVLNVCAFVVCFTIVLRLLTAAGALTVLAGWIGAALAPLGFDESWAARLLTGLLEVSTGVAALTGTGHLAGRIALAAFCLGWGGLSVHCQTAALLEGSGLRLGGYLMGKLLHGVLSAALALAACRVCLRAEPVEVFAANAPVWAAEAEAPNLLLLSLGLTLATVILCGTLLLRRAAKNSGKGKKSVV